MTGSIIYPPNWVFATPDTVKDISIGDLFPVEMQKPRTTSTDYECVNCRDYKVVYAREITSSGPVTWINGRRFCSRVVSAACPVCRGDQLANWLRANCGLEKLELDGKPCLEVKLKDLKPYTGQVEAFDVANKLLKELPEPKTWALFSGDNGRGKTHILCGLINGCIARRVWAVYAKSETILEELRRSYDDYGGSQTIAVRRKYENVPALVVDEVDKIKWTNWSGAQLFAMLDARKMTGKATWFASNRGPLELEKLNDTMRALVSRISSGEMAALSGPDFRPMSQSPLPDRFHD